MFTVFCAKYLEIAKVQIKLTLRMNLLLALSFAILIPIIFGISNLDNQASAFVLEHFISFTGIILLTPLFFPEQDKSTAELAESKYTSPTGIYIARFILAVLALIILISGFIAVMIFMSCEVDILKYIIGTFATAFFLGSAGFITCAISGNIVLGYSIPLGYYMFNMFIGGKLKNLYLFSLENNSLTEKYWLLGIGAVLIMAGILFKYVLRKKSPVA